MTIENENNSIEIVIAPKEKCTVSYTLNNEQPVRSTHIGNQPLFYMDYEIDFDEEESFADSFSEELQEFEAASFALQNNKYDQVSKHFSKEASWREELIKENSADICASEINKDTYKIEELTALINKSRIGGAHLEFAQEKGVQILTSQVTLDAETAFAERIILLNDELSFEDATLSLARELRRFWQKEQGVLINPLSFHPDQAIVVNRAQIADLNVFAVRMAWELQLADEKALWEYIEHSSLADIGRAYAREACEDFRTMNNGEAAQAGFEAWFLSERCRKSDKVLIQQMLSEYNGYVFGEDSAASKNVAFKLLSKLGEYPFGKNYLQPYAQVILNDPVFTEVRDRSNANFLWFIKFERSFQEAEQELQSDLGEQHSDIRDSKNGSEQENVFFIRGQESTDECEDINAHKVLQFKPRRT